MYTSIRESVPSRARRRHSEEFKAEVIEACLQPGVSIAGVALANRLNANMVRLWLKAHRIANPEGVPSEPVGRTEAEPNNGSATTLVPVSLDSAGVVGDIQIEIRLGKAIVKIAWPVREAKSSAEWLREVLR